MKTALAAAGGLALAASWGAACSEPAGATGGSTSGGTSASSGIEDLSDVVYEGGATDEALFAMLAHAPIGAESDGAHFLSPADGAALPAGEPVEFDWAAGSTAVNTYVRSPLDAGGSSRGGLLERAVAFALDEHEALAHGAPISGRAYFLVFASEGNPKLLRVFTTNLTYAPDATHLAALAGAGPITVRIEDAIFDENRLTEGGGPFVGPPLTFSIANGSK